VPKPKSASSSGGGASRSSSGSTKGKKRSSKAKAPKVPDSMFTSTAGAREAIETGVIGEIDADLPIYYPKVQEKQSRYKPQMSTGYDLASPGGMKFPWQAYRLVVELGRGDAGPGQYYGIQGTT